MRHTKRNRSIACVLAAFVFFPFVGYGQEDLLKLAQADEKKSSEKVEATFKGTRIVNSQSIQTSKARMLDFHIAHRFGTLGEGGNVHNMFGLFQVSDIRFAFEYGITDRLMAGISRFKSMENYEGFLKFRLFQQTEDNKIPVSVTLHTNAALTGVADVDSVFLVSENRNSTRYGRFAHRFSFLTQALIARKFTSAFSLQLMPAYLHRNIVGSEDQNGLFSIGFGGRLKFAKRAAIIADYYYTFSNLRNKKGSGFFDPLGIGIELETGGHVFNIMFSNSAGLLENDYLVNTRNSWSKGGIRFSFNISRGFVL
jgi:hypothetical protein